ncbi:hypothetical protein B0H19DRAFT_1266963 [Mycena capillaripes]|nr:hypothetical protein B0H19DRAFT_1266963 [Mycena capillaripes]
MSFTAVSPHCGCVVWQREVADIGGFVAYVLISLPPSKLQDRIFRLDAWYSSPRPPLTRSSIPPSISSPSPLRLAYSLPLSKLQDRILRLESERTSPNNLGVQLNRPVMHIERIEGDEAKTALLKPLDSRAGSTGWDEENQREKTGSDGGPAGSANPLWAGHRWKRIREVLNL